MNYISMFISWFLEHFTSEEVSMVQLILTLGLACVNAVYIFLVYRMLTRKTFYSKRYNITVASTAVIITAIIFTVQSSVVISLGMVGALSIVRFRTAIKDALDIVFLFWAVAIGVCYGAHMAEIAIILSAILTMLIFGLDGISVRKNQCLLIVEAGSEEAERAIEEQLNVCCRRYKIKARKQEEKCYKVVAEVKVRQEFQMMQKLEKISGVKSVSLIAHEGETTY